MGQDERFESAALGTVSAVDGTTSERDRDRMTTSRRWFAVPAASGDSDQVSNGSTTMPIQPAVREANAAATWNGNDALQLTGTAIAESSARSSGATRTFSQGESRRKAGSMLGTIGRPSGESTVGITMQ